MRNLNFLDYILLLLGLLPTHLLLITCYSCYCYFCEIFGYWMHRFLHQELQKMLSLSDLIWNLVVLHVFLCVLRHRALYYQRRWVKLDVDYLRYFDNEKVIIMLSSYRADSSWWCRNNGRWLCVVGSVFKGHHLHFQNHKREQRGRPEVWGRHKQPDIHLQGWKRRCVYTGFICLTVNFPLCDSVWCAELVMTCLYISVQLRGMTGWLYCRTAPGGATHTAPSALTPLWILTTKAIWSSEGCAPNYTPSSPQTKCFSTRAKRWESTVGFILTCN